MLVALLASSLLAVSAVAVPQPTGIRTRDNHKATEYSCADETMEFPGDSEWFKDADGNESQEAIKSAFLVHYRSVRDSHLKDGHSKWTPVVNICFPKLKYLPEGQGVEHHGEWSNSKVGSDGRALLQLKSNLLQAPCDDDDEVDPDIGDLEVNGNDIGIGKDLFVANGNGCKTGSAHGLDESLGDDWEIRLNGKQSVKKAQVGDNVRCSGADHGVSCLFGLDGNEQPWDLD